MKTTLRNKCNTWYWPEYAFISYIFNGNEMVYRWVNDYDNQLDQQHITWLHIRYATLYI